MNNCETDIRPRSVGQNRESLGEGEEQSLKQKVCPNRYAKSLGRGRKEHKEETEF
jgi:hypothetical protein